MKPDITLSAALGQSTDAKSKTAPVSALEKLLTSNINLNISGLGGNCASSDDIDALTNEARSLPSGCKAIIPPIEEFIEYADPPVLEPSGSSVVKLELACESIKDTSSAASDVTLRNDGDLVLTVDWISTNGEVTKNGKLECGNGDKLTNVNSTSQKRRSQSAIQNVKRRKS